MNKKEVIDLVSSGTPQVFSIDHKHKSEVQRQTLNTVVSEAKKALARKTTVHVILVR